ncbi:MAG: branched-chain-amino-acid transaminase [Clostridia bacterium]
MKIFLDGKYVDEAQATISVFDHGVLYGDGIFEGIRAYNGRVFRLDEHIDRLFMAATAICLVIPYTKKEMAEIIVNTCKINNLSDCYVRLVITRGKGDLGISPTKCPKPTTFCIATSIALYTTEMYENGIAVITAMQRRNKPSTIDPQIKSLNYLNNILAKIEANRLGAPEALMLNHDGIVCEATGDNVYIVKDNVVYTPPIYVGCLDGITRKVIIECCEKLGIKICERQFTLFNVYNADECFLSGTAAEAIAVTSVDGRTIGTGKCGPITAKILEAFRAYAKTEECGTKIQ